MFPARSWLMQAYFPVGSSAGRSDSFALKTEAHMLFADWGHLLLCSVRLWSPHQAQEQTQIVVLNDFFKAW